VVDVVARLDDLAVAHAHDEDGGHLPRLPALDERVAVGELGAAALVALEEDVRRRKLAIAFDGLAPPGRRPPMLPGW
jgi:hypothetical protein